MRPPEEELGSYTADWDGYNELWQVTVFPAQRPDGREQIGHLRNCLNRMLRAEGQAAVSVGIVPPGTQPSLLQILDGAPDADRTYRVLHSIFAAGMHEIARQVSCNCAERGQLMMNVWSSVEALRERMLEIREERVRKAERETEQVKKDLAHAQERLQALEDVESSNAQKDADLAKLMQSREQHLEMMKTLRAALASLEEQLRASHASRKAAEAKLRTWLPHYDTYSSNAALEALEAHEAASRELSAEVAPVGDTDGKATVSASGDDAEELKARAAQWRASVRAQAAQLADWEASPSLPDDVPLDVEALKLLMQDAGHILGAVVCLRDDSAEACKDGSSGSTDKERVARPADDCQSSRAAGRSTCRSMNSACSWRLPERQVARSGPVARASSCRKGHWSCRAFVSFSLKPKDVRSRFTQIETNLTRYKLVITVHRREKSSRAWMIAISRAITSQRIAIGAARTYTPCRTKDDKRSVSRAVEPLSYAFHLLR